MRDAATPQGMLTYNYRPSSWHAPPQEQEGGSLKELRNWKD